MLEIDLQRAEVGLIPAGLELLPRQRGLAFGVAMDVDAAAVNVIGDVLEARVVAQDERQVAQRVLDPSLLIQLQLLLPVIGLEF